MRTFLSPLVLRAVLGFALVVLSGSVACEVHTHGRSSTPRHHHHDNGRHRGHQKHHKSRGHHHDNGRHRGHQKHQKSRGHHDNGHHRGHEKHRGRH